MFLTPAWRLKQVCYPWLGTEVIRQQRCNSAVKFQIQRACLFVYLFVCRPNTRRSSAVSVVTSLRARRSGVQVLAEACDFSLLYKRPDWFWGPPSLIFNVSKGTGAPPLGYSRGVKFTTHLMPRLGMSGAIHLLCLYGFLVWKGKASPFTFSIITAYTHFSTKSTKQCV